MKKILLPLSFFALAMTGAYAQVGIGTNNPDKSAQLDITSDPERRGLLIPRLELKGINDKLNAAYENANSLLVFNTKAFDGHPIGYYYWREDSTKTNGGEWVHILSTAEESIANIFNDKGSVTYNATDKKLTVRAKNGVELVSDPTNGDYVALGGDLTKETTIGLNGNDLKLTGLGTIASGVGGLVVVDSDNNLKKITKVDSDQIADDAVGDDQLDRANVTLAGDVTGNLDATKVEAIQGKAVEAFSSPITSADKGKVLVFDDASETWKPELLSGKSINLTEIAGDGITHNTVTNKLDVDATNGIRVDGGKVKLGGKLIEETTIGLNGNDLKLTGLDVINANVGGLVVVDSDNNLKQITKVDSDQIADDAVGDDQLDRANVTLAGDVTGNLDATKVGAIQGKAVEALPETTTTADNGKVLVYEHADGPNAGKWVPKTLKDAATIDYTNEPQDTGRNWTLGSTPGAPISKPIKEVTMSVDFGDGKTAFYLGTAATENKAEPSFTNLDITIVSVRLVSKSNKGVTQSIASYDQGENGKVVVGMAGQGFSVTHKGQYFVILEYFEN